jgi:hypothetical protein
MEKKESFTLYGERIDDLRYLSFPSLFYGLGMEKKRCFFQGKGFSQPSLFIVKEMTTLDTFLSHPYSMA